MLDVIKSRRSNKFLSNNLYPPSMPKDKDAGIDISPMMQNNIIQAFVLEILYLSIIEAIGTSIMLMPDVIAAASSNMKNAIETILPCGICANI